MHPQYLIVTIRNIVIVQMECANILHRINQILQTKFAMVMHVPGAVGVWRKLDGSGGRSGEDAAVAGAGVEDVMGQGGAGSCRRGREEQGRGGAGAGRTWRWWRSEGRGGRGGGGGARGGE